MNTSQVPITDSRNWQLFLLFTPQSTKKKNTSDQQPQINLFSTGRESFVSSRSFSGRCRSGHGTGCDDILYFRKKAKALRIIASAGDFDHRLQD